MAEPNPNIDIENNCKLVKDTIDNLLDAFKILEVKIDSMAGNDDINKYQEKMKELREQNNQLKSELTTLKEKDLRMAVLLSIHEENKLKQLQQLKMRLRIERIKTKIVNLCRNELGITEKLDIQRPLRAPNKKAITADVSIDFETDENFNNLLKNIPKLINCKVIVKKQTNKKLKNKLNDGGNDENCDSRRKYLLRFRQEIEQNKNETKTLII